MNPLKVALLVKQSPSTRLRLGRNMGYWSYGVEDFIWEHDTPNGGIINLDAYSSCDVVIQEDAGNWEIRRGHKSPPLVYICIDSTLSDQHFASRYNRAKQADLVLVDHDDLLRFKRSGKPVRRLTYCVNDMLFKPAEKKDIDVNFHCGGGAGRGIPGGEARLALRHYLHELCHELDWQMVSGGVGLDQYANEMGRSKTVVNHTRTDSNRSHRIFDALAAGTCLITNPFPLQGCGLISGLHYRVYNTHGELRDILEEVIPDDGWMEFAGEGRRFVKENHTWMIRAKELRAILAQELKI